MPGKDADFFVSAKGNDEWSGTQAVPTEGGTDGPFASLTRARDAVRKLRKDVEKGDIRILIREGTYHLRKTIVLGIER